jgi:NAD(P)-dependent dehydrogenase (short-subunit alcohol dehydrogenase family)
MEVTGKAALITGGARIGQTVALDLARRGCSLALTYRGSLQAAEKTAAEARALGVRAEVIQADATRAAEVTAAVDRAAGALGRLDILISMASTYVKTPVATLTEAQWREGIDANLHSAWLFAMQAAPHMKRAGAGRIVNISDWLPASGRPRYLGYAPYYVAKAGVAALTQALALELAPAILVNAVAPGPILPPPGLTAAEDARVIEATPLRRWGGAAEVSRAVLFLVETEFVTGETLRVDGGRHLF